MARQGFTTELNVWTRPKKDDSADWALQLTTEDPDEAQQAAEQAANARTISTVFERGRFMVEGKRKTDQIMFWWSESYYDTMEEEPQGRGHGWSEEYETFVDYEYPNGTALVISDIRSSEVDVPRQKQRYAMVNCEICGIELPQNEAQVYTHNVEVGHSSGSYRFSSSSTHRLSRRSSSNSYTSGTSRTSGRKYYKRESVFLCANCFEERQGSDQVDFFSKLVLYIIGGLLLIGYFFFHAAKN